MDGRYNRGKSGKFDFKGGDLRRVRSLRATDAVWEKLGEIADQRGITRADVIEKMAYADGKAVEEVIEVLEEALLLKANAGGAIKERVRKAIDLLKENF